MAKIHDLLQEWQNNGLISASQQDGILAYENSKPKTRWGQLGFLILGIGTVVLGLISIIASNWHLIPASVKLVSGFAIMIITASAIYKTDGKKSALIVDGLRAFFALYCFAMIGLIAQIYNLHGDDYKTGLLWSFMTVLVISEAKNFLVPLIWTSVFGVSLLVGLNNYPLAEQYVTNPLAFFILTLTIILLMMEKFVPRSPIKSSFAWFTYLAWMIGLVLSSVSFRGQTYMASRFTTYNAGDYVAEYILSLLVIGLIWISSTLKKTEKIAFIFSLLLANVLLSINYLAKEAYILLILGSILCLGCWAFYFLSRERLRHFNFVMLIIAGKVFEIFVRQFNTLLATGLGLVIMGAMLLLVIYFWSKNRQAIEARLQEMIR